MNYQVNYDFTHKLMDQNVLTHVNEMPKMRHVKDACHSALAQLVEQMTVNHWVAGSSPAGGATGVFL